MSLINQVLRDLDAREAAEAGRRELADRVRPLPAERGYSWRPAALALGSCLLGAAAAWVVLPKVAETTPAGAAPVTAAVPSPAPTIVVNNMLPPAAEPMPVSPVAAPALAERAKAAELPVKKATEKAAENTPALRLERKMPTTAQPVAAAPAAQIAAPTPARSEPAPVAAPRLGEFQSVEPAQLEKRPRGPTVSEAADVEYRKAMNAFRRGATQEALTGLRGTLLVDARHAQARQALLSVLVEGQNWLEAMAAAEEGLRLDPAQTGWAMILARLQVDHRGIAEAVDTLARHARYAERNPDYLGLQAALLQRAGRPHDAIERYQVALAQRPGESRWWFGLGNALESDKRPQEAREAYLKARDTGNLSQELAAALEQRLR